MRTRTFCGRIVRLTLCYCAHCACTMHVMLVTMQSDDISDDISVDFQPYNTKSTCSTRSSMRLPGLPAIRMPFSDSAAMSRSVTREMLPSCGQKQHPLQGKLAGFEDGCVAWCAARMWCNLHVKTDRMHGETEGPRLRLPGARQSRDGDGLPSTPPGGIVQLCDHTYSGKLHIRHMALHRQGANRIQDNLNNW